VVQPIADVSRLNGIWAHHWFWEAFLLEKYLEGISCTILNIISY